MNYFRNDLKFVLIFIVIGFIIGPKIFASQREKIVLEAAVTKEATQVNVPESSNKADPFRDIKIGASSAFVYDIANQKILFAKDGESKRPLASITKIMTAIIAVESRTKPESVTINAADLESEGDNGLVENEKWRLNNLLALTLVTSSNDGAEAIAASVGYSLDKTKSGREAEVGTFVDRMNQKSKELELNSFYFTTPTGLDLGNTPGGVGSAHDVAKLFEYVLRRHSNLLQYTAAPELKIESESKVVHRVVNTNEIASITSGIIGGKTGFTDLAGGNLAVVVDVGIQHPVAIVVLGSTREKRFSDVLKLLESTKQSINN